MWVKIKWYFLKFYYLHFLLDTVYLLKLFLNVKFVRLIVTSHWRDAYTAFLLTENVIFIDLRRLFVFLDIVGLTIATTQHSLPQSLKKDTSSFRNDEPKIFLKWNCASLANYHCGIHNSSTTTGTLFQRRMFSRCSNCVGIEKRLRNEMRVCLLEAQFCFRRNTPFCHQTTNNYWTN